MLAKNTTMEEKQSPVEQVENDSYQRTSSIGIVSFLSWILNNTTKTILLLSLTLLLFTILNDASKNPVYIESFKVPEELNKFGVTNNMLAQQLTSSVHLITEEANSEKDVTKPIARHQQLDFQIPQAQISFSNLKRLIQELLFIQPTRITGFLACVKKCEESSEFNIEIQLFRQSEQTTSHMVTIKRENLQSDHRLAIWLLEQLDPYIAGVYHYKKGNFNRVIQIATPLIANGRYRHWARNLLGLVHMRQGQYSLAEEHFTNVLKRIRRSATGPEYSRVQKLAQSNLAYLYSKMDEINLHSKRKELKELNEKNVLEYKKQIFEKAQFLRPRAAIVRKHYAEMLSGEANRCWDREDGEPVPTSKELETAIRLNKQAIEKYKEARDIDPSDYSIHRGLANAYWSQGKIMEKSLGDKEKAAYQRHENPDDKPKNPEAYQAIRQAHQLAPENIKVLKDWGKFLIEHGELLEAKKKLQQGLGIDSNDAKLNKHMGHVFYYLSNPKATTPASIGFGLRYPAVTYYVTSLRNSNDETNQKQVLVKLIEVLEQKNFKHYQQRNLAKYKSILAKPPKKRPTCSHEE